MKKLKDDKQFTTLGNALSSRKVKALLVGFALMCGFLLTITSVPATATNGNLVLYAPQTSTPPIIDGVLSPGEWNGSTHYKTYFVPTSAHPSDDIDVFLLSQNDALYIAYDVQPDNTTESDDMAYLAFDLDNDNTQDFILYVSRNRVSNMVRLEGVNCTSLVWEIAFGFNTTPQETGRNHTIIEIKIGLNQSPYTTQTATGLTHLPLGISPVGVCFGGYGTLSPGWFYGNSSTYNNFLNPDATSYADLYLGSMLPPPTAFTAPYTSTPPTIDGVLSPGEWSGATQLQIYFLPSSYHPPDYINVFLLSQDDTLYIAYDVLPDDTTEDADAAYLCLDLDNNDTMDIVMYAYRNPTFPRSVELKSTNCSSLIWGIAFGNGTSPHEPNRNHTVIEMWFRVSQTPYTNQTATGLTHLPLGNSPVGAIFAGYGTLTPTWVCGNSSFVDNLYDIDASMYGNLTLGSPPGEPGDGNLGWILALAIGLPAIAAVAVILFLRKRKKEA